MKSFLLRWLITTLAVLIAIQIVPGIRADTNMGLLVATLLLGLLNAVVRPVLIILALPLVILTLGLAIIPINMLLLWWVGHLKDFHVVGFWSTFWGSLIISVVGTVLNNLTGGSKTSVQFHRGGPPPQRPPDDDGDGPIIDV
jgi:putative membrane protein